MAYSLTAHNTFGIDATCDTFFQYNTEEEVQQILPQLRNHRWLHIGAGSNILFVHPHFEGIIVHCGITDWHIVNETSTTIDICAGAGLEMDDFIAEMIVQHYYGLENLSHIPGEVGASAVQNVGAYGVESGDFIIKVSAIDVENGDKVELHHDDCAYAYRYSRFKTEWRGKYLITHVTFRLQKTFVPVLTHASVPRKLAEMGLSPETCTAADLRKAIIDIRSAKLPDPKVIGSAGSFFMNPIVTQEEAQHLIARYPEMPHYNVENGIKIPAGWLIEQIGWKGKTFGKVGVHPQQALVLINLGGATGEDVVHLAHNIQEEVQRQFGIRLHPEVLYI